MWRLPTAWRSATTTQLRRWHKRPGRPNLWGVQRGLLYSGAARSGSRHHPTGGELLSASIPGSYPMAQRLSFGSTIKEHQIARLARPTAPASQRWSGPTPPGFHRRPVFDDSPLTSRSSDRRSVAASSCLRIRCRRGGQQNARLLIRRGQLDLDSGFSSPADVAAATAGAAVPSRSPFRPA
jgi:hypothetical protein